MTHLSIRSQGSNNWTSRPSDHRVNDAYRRLHHGPIKGMQEPGLIAKLFGAR